MAVLYPQKPGRRVKSQHHPLVAPRMLALVLALVQAQALVQGELPWELLLH
jgi:hypothetical protein